MSNALISYPDHTITGSLSGGSWLSTLPLSNLQSRLLSKKARSSNALAASTIVQVDLGATARAVRCVGVLSHNISYAGTIRARGYSDSGYTSLVTGADTGTVNVWPQSGFTATDATQYPNNLIYAFTSSKTARYWKIEITDTANAAGYVEMGRVWIGEGNFEPATGFSYGASLGYEARDVIEESLGGVRWGEKRTPRRSWSIAFDALTEAEKQKALIMQKVLTTTDEMLFIANSQATAQNMLLEAFPATAQQLSPLVYPYYDNNQLPMQLLEVV